MAPVGANDGREQLSALMIPGPGPLLFLVRPYRLQADDAESPKDQTQKKGEKHHRTCPCDTGR